MKAIEIDSTNRMISEVEVSGLEDMQKQVDGLIELATELENGDVVYVDEEGLMKSNIAFFDIGAHQPFAGDGLVVGTGKDGDSKSCKSTIEEIGGRVNFMNLFEVRSSFK